MGMWPSPKWAEPNKALFNTLAEHAKNADAMLTAQFAERTPFFFFDDSGWSSFLCSNEVFLLVVSHPGPMKARSGSPVRFVIYIFFGSFVHGFNSCSHCNSCRSYVSFLCLPGPAQKTGNSDSLESMDRLPEKQYPHQQLVNQWHLLNISTPMTTMTTKRIKSIHVLNR